MPQIYVTYRYGDTTSIEHQQLIDFLVQEYGADKVTLSKAEEHIDYLDLTDLIYQQDAVIVLIGNRFLNLVDTDGNALLWGSSDYLHVELTTAIEAVGIRIVLVLTDGATAPEQNDLPASLHEILSYPVFEMDTTKTEHFFKKLKSHLDKNVKIRHASYKSPQTLRDHSPVTYIPERQQTRQQRTRVVVILAITFFLFVVTAIVTNLYTHVDLTIPPTHTPTNTVIPTETLTPTPYNDREIHHTFIDNPEWEFDSEVLAGASVTIGRRIYITVCSDCHATDMTYRTIQHFTFNYNPVTPEHIYTRLIAYSGDHGVATTTGTLPFGDVTLTREEVYAITEFLVYFFHAE